MAKFKMTLLRQSRQWHIWLSWLGGIALLIFALSGLTHPIMSWTGPQAKTFFPPHTMMQADIMEAVAPIIEKHHLTQAVMFKAIPSMAGKTVWQLTETDGKERRYFDPETHEELPDHDEKQAIWLARYYTGLHKAPIKDIQLKTEFDDEYPWVNRLLPVYRVAFDSQDNRIAFIYTELNALSGLTNDWKTSLQTIFRAFHTWSWLDNFEHSRIILMMLFLLCLTGMAATGTALVFTMKSRRIPDYKRRWHRLIAYGIWLPLLGFSASGIYHLLQYGYGDNHRGLKLGTKITLSAKDFLKPPQILQTKQYPLQAVSIVQTDDGKSLYRLAVAEPARTVTRQQRFQGKATTKKVIYSDVISGETLSITDRDMAIAYAGQHMGYAQSSITDVLLVTHFGPHYDFRNKRLPVWQIDYDSPLGDKVFIDPATGMLVDRLTDQQRYEGYSFSFLHKWNFFTPFIGRYYRDILIVVILGLAIASTLFGYMILLKKRR